MGQVVDRDGRDSRWHSIASRLGLPGYTGGGSDGHEKKELK
jgi:hypothetical protein